MQRIGVIGGSGVYSMPGLRLLREESVATPFGNPSAPYSIFGLDSVEAVFLPRHGKSHEFPPHRINYRANIYGFKELGVQRLFSINAAGGINPSYKAGDIVIPDQILDMTQGARASTYYEEGEVVHIDFTDPYCPELRASALGAASEEGIRTIDGGVYACVNGPRLETRAEIKFLSGSGADLVGMTGMPEAALARELQICLASICIVTNPAAGIRAGRLSAKEVLVRMKESEATLNRILRTALGLVPSDRKCACGGALKDARV